MLRKNFKSHWRHLLVIGFSIILQFRNFITSPSYPGGMDSLGSISTVSFFSESFRYLNIWNETSLGYVTPIILYHLLAFINVFFQNPAFLIKLFLIFSFIVSGFFMYYFTFHLTSSKLCGTVTTFIFLYNRWITAKVSSGHFLHVEAYLMLPILFYFLDRLLKERNLRNLIFFTLAFSLIPLLRWDPLLYIAPFLGIYVLFRLYSCDIIAKRFLNFALIFVAILSLLTVYLWLSVIRVGTEHTSLSWSQEQIKGFTLEILPTILGQPRELGYEFWVGHTDWNTHPFLTLHQYYLTMLIIPILAFSAILMKRKRVILAFTFGAVLSLFFAKGTYPPFGGFYSLLYQNLSLFGLIHVPNRFLMMTYFFYSLLAGFTLSRICQIVNEKFRGGYSNYFSFILVIMILLTGILLPNYFIIKNGYRTWKPIEEELSPHRWLEKQSNGRVVTVPYAQSYMFTQEGCMERDLGGISYMYSSKSVMNSLPDFQTNSRNFLEYIKKILVEEKTHKLPSILGIYDLKYVILQGYPPTTPDKILKKRLDYYQHVFFENQKGLIEVYKGNEQNYSLRVADSWAGVLAPKLEPPKLRLINVKRSPKVYKNEYRIPRIFAPIGQVMVIGGLESFLKLAEIESFSFDTWNLFFADSIVEYLGKDALVKQIDRSDYVMFVNSGPLDLVMLLADAIRIKVKNFEKNSAGWRQDDRPIIEGFFVYSRDLVATREKKAKAIYNVQIGNDSNYEIWIRTFSHNKTGKLMISVGQEMVGEVEQHASQKFGFKWIKAGEIKLKKGKHKIEVVNEKGENKLNGIIIVKKGEIRKVLDYVKKSVDRKHLYLLDVEKLEKIGLDPLKLFEEEVIFEDKWGSQRLWTPTFPEKVKFSDSSNRISGKSPLRIGISLRPKPGGVANKRFSAMDDWSEEKIDELLGNNFILYRNDKPVGNATVKTEGINRVKYLDFEKIRPSKWVAKVNSTAPYTLVFSNSYHPMWRAYVNGKEYKTIPSYYFINSFQIREIGEHEVAIEFIGQRIQNISLIISALAYLGCFGYLFYDWRKARKKAVNK